MQPRQPVAISLAFLIGSFKTLQRAFKLASRGRTRSPSQKYASSEESVGDVRLRQFTKCMIQGDFCDVEGAETN